jgi:hypothetical protein
MIGERGGTTSSLDEARERQEAHKALWSQTIRQAILETLEVHGTYHADDLLTLGIPAECKNIVGAQTNAIVRQGLMAETGERRSTSDPAGHGRRSAVYRITEKGRTKLRSTNQVTAGESLGGPETGSRGGGSAGEGCASLPDSIPAAAISGREAIPQGGGDVSSLSATTALPTLFSLEPPPRSHYEEEAA